MATLRKWRWRHALSVFTGCRGVNRLARMVFQSWGCADWICGKPPVDGRGNFTV